MYDHVHFLKLHSLGEVPFTAIFYFLSLPFLIGVAVQWQSNFSFTHILGLLTHEPSSSYSFFHQQVIIDPCWCELKERHQCNSGGWHGSLSDLILQFTCTLWLCSCWSQMYHFCPLENCFWSCQTSWLGETSGILLMIDSFGHMITYILGSMVALFQIMYYSLLRMACLAPKPWGSLLWFSYWGLSWTSHGPSVTRYIKYRKICHVWLKL